MLLQVAWLGGGGPTGETSKVRYAEEDMERLRVVDRGMMVGDVVAAAAAPLGQVRGRREKLNPGPGACAADKRPVPLCVTARVHGPNPVLTSTVPALSLLQGSQEGTHALKWAMAMPKRSFEE
jgi:hypothetical protein